MSEAPHLLTELADEGRVLVATLNRPEKLNAMSNQMFALLEEALYRFRDTDEIKVMLIRATGRYFTAGADLKEGDAQERADTARQAREMLRVRMRGSNRIYDEIEHIEKPIVAAHHAHCVGGGLELSLCCDFRFAAESTTYSFPEGMFGTIPASSGLSRLTRICGPHWARWLIMANKPVSSEMAYTMGLVHQVYPDGSFEDEVMDFCRHLARQNGEQMGAAKIAIEMAYEVSRDTARNVERMANSALMLNPDYRARMAEYLSKLGGKNKG